MYVWMDIYVLDIYYVGYICAGSCDIFGKLLQAEWWPRIIALAGLIKNEPEDFDLQRMAFCATVWFAVSSLRHHLSGACGPREGLVDLDGLYSKTVSA